ncbi:MAG: hypothetical protein E2O84_05055 [Bacteroidetes bacterium]|nr:MAG: hypothetical protein E2O84_05055 [Bacteroidota bacterium]
MKSTFSAPRIVAATVLFSALMMSGCSVDSVGPPGPAGNANVFSIGLRFEMVDAVINGTVASVQYDVPALTPLVVDEGAILLFFRDQGTWTAMPYTYGVESLELPAVDYTVSFGFGYEVEFLEIFYEVSTDAADITSLPDRNIKMVVIDGFPFGKSSIDLSDWLTVKAFYGLKE